jgi:hypothetical protein
MILFMWFSLVTVSQMFFKVAFIAYEAPKSKATTSRFSSDGDKAKRKQQPRRGLKGEDVDQEEEGKQDPCKSTQMSPLAPIETIKALWRGVDNFLHIDALRWNRPHRVASGSSPTICLVALWLLLSNFQVAGSSKE